MARGAGRYAGVSLRRGGFQAYVTVNGVHQKCGVWRDEVDAAVARDRAVLFLAQDKPLNDPGRARELGPLAPAELQRLAHLRRREGTTNPFLGVSLAPNERWDTWIYVPGEGRRRIAQFDWPSDAAMAHDRVALHVLGEEAELNFPDNPPAPATFEEVREWARELRRTRQGIDAPRVIRKKDRWAVVVPGPPHYRLGTFRTEAEATVARERIDVWRGVDPGEVSPAARRLGAASPLEIGAELDRVNPRRNRAWKRHLEAAGFDGGVPSTPSEPTVPGLAAVRPRRKGKSSAYTGVSWSGTGGFWVATIHCHGKYHQLGTFSDEIRAAEAYDDAGRELAAPRAKINFPGRKSPRRG
jgi:hypothetical protein